LNQLPVLFSTKLSTVLNKIKEIVIQQLLFLKQKAIEPARLSELFGFLFYLSWQLVSNILRERLVICLNNLTRDWPHYFDT